MNRPEVSNKNRYWISKHRYYELKHFCLQYQEWKKELASLDGWGLKNDVHNACKEHNECRPTESIAVRRSILKSRIEAVEKSAYAADPAMREYLLKGVTKGISYDHLLALYDIPCSKDAYYNLYRKFFWILSETRQ